jgi:hypothetical protein
VAAELNTKIEGLSAKVEGLDLKIEGVATGLDAKMDKVLAHLEKKRG